MLYTSNIGELRKKYRADNYIAFTMDVDWASEDCISEMLGFFSALNFPITVFCTHPSKALSLHTGDPSVELGVHPNYCFPSSQGATIDEVTDYVMKLVPGARAVRGHRWFESNDMYDRLTERGIRYDSNDCTLMDLAEPFIHRSNVLRFPVFFEDGGMLWNGFEPDFAANGKPYFSGNGLKVLDLHPIHYAINSPTLAYYRHVCDDLMPGLSGMTNGDISRLRYKGAGIRTYVMELVEYIYAKHINVVSLGQIYDEFEFERK